MTRAAMFVISVLLISACQQKADSPQETEYAQIMVTDFAGNKVKLAEPAKRIVALAPHLVENVYTAGAGESLVGVVSYSNFPEQAKSLPIVGGYEKTNHERILELQPDLILAWQSGNSHNSVQLLREMGFNIYVDQADSLQDVSKTIIDIGVLTANEDVANTAAFTYLQQLESYKLKFANKELVSTFYQVWNQPLQTISGGHIISDVIEICGGRNIYADEMAVAPMVNIETLLERNPEAIIASGMSEQRPEWLDDWKDWPSLKAVQRNNLFFVNPDHIQRHTTRLLFALETVCAQLELARERRVINQ